MRIDPNTSAQQAQESDKATASNAHAAAPSSQGASATDTAQLSPDQVRVQALVAQVNALPEVRQNRVDALGRAIREGNYQVSAEQTAAAMLADLAQPVAA